jgi:hypothetical protein
MSGLRGVIAGGVLVVTVGGCASWPLARAGQPMLERADRLAHEGAWEDAAAAYGEYLDHHPQAEEAPRAAASRDALRALITARAELSKAREELGRSREELARLREEIARRDGELGRVRQETERLKVDLEKLKQVDLKLERRK